MGAKTARVHDPSQSELDEGWGLDEVGALPILVRLVPESDSTPIASQDVLADDWTLLSEDLSAHDHTQPSPIAITPAPLDVLTQLTPCVQAEFSEPHLALGTDVDLPAPSEPWFNSLRPASQILPAPSSSRPQGHTPVHAASSDFSASEHAFFEMGDELAELENYEFSDEPPAPTRGWRWWPWLRRSRK